MGIQVEFNPDLALRHINHYKKGERSIEECIPENLQEDKVYEFLKKGQRNYWLEGEIPLLQTEGEGKLSRPLASILILDAIHFMRGKEIYTKGKYLVKDVFDPDDPAVHFDGFARTL